MRAILLLLLSWTTCSAELYRVSVEERRDVLDGKSFGSAGPYEIVKAKGYFRVDPTAAANKLVRDIESAPRNQEGLVEFSADVFVIKPRDPAKGNGTLLLEIANRGRKGLLSTFQFAEGSANPTTADHFGDGLLFEQGFTLAWVGWQFDVFPDPDVIKAYLPTFRAKGLVRSQIRTTKAGETTFPLGDRTHQPYPATDWKSAVMTVRASSADKPMVVPRGDWDFSDPTHVTMKAGFQPGKLYEVVYTSEQAVPIGLGMAAVRDFVSFLKYPGAETLLSDQRRFLKRAIAFGSSQSGRFLRNYVYDGFNADEKGRKVFDGLLPSVAGAGRGSFNIRYGQPSRDAQPSFNVMYPTDLFPFTDTDETDSTLKISGSLLSRAKAANVVPKIMYINGAYEYWGRTAALIHVSADGKSDVPPSPDTRIYFLSGAQHGPGKTPPSAGTSRYTSDPLDQRAAFRALLMDLHFWLKDGVEPPASMIPAIAAGNLVPVSKLKSIPQADYPVHPTRAYRLDFGPDFTAKGISTIEPARHAGEPYPLLVPQVDADGNEIAGLHMPEHMVPLGTYTGWNIEKDSPEMIAFAGSFFPFAKTKADRERKRDPRPSIEERYKSKKDYLSRLEAAARECVSRRIVLERDVPMLVERASELWDWCMR